MRDEPRAAILTEALEGFASGRFVSPAEVKRFLDNQPDWPKPPSGGVLLQSLHYILPRVIYAGYIDLPDWEIAMVRGQH